MEEADVDKTDLNLIDSEISKVREEMKVLNQSLGLLLEQRDRTYHRVLCEVLGGTVE